MKKVIFDFRIIDSEEKLYDYIESELNINQYVQGNWGRNLHAFWDAFAYSGENILFEMRNVNGIANQQYKEIVKAFAQYLEDIKGYEDNGKKIIPNPKFDYIVIN